MTLSNRRRSGRPAGDLPAPGVPEATSATAQLGTQAARGHALSPRRPAGC